jgi:superfamily II DNA or RNA helicase
VTGTFPKDDYMKFNLESFTGPLVYKLTAFQLINVENFATPIYIISDILDYAPDSDKEVLYMGRLLKEKDSIEQGNRLLKQEQTYSMKSFIRLKYICDLADKCKHNTLVLFNDVNVNKYGRKIYDYLKENSEKTVFYADGNTDTSVRDYYKQCMEEDTSGNTVIVGSIGCFSEGIDVSNLWTIILANSVKSEFIVRQFIGRGMRRMEGKDKVVIFDIVDDFVYGPKTEKWKRDNYLMNHYKERKKIYQEQGFPLFERKIQFKREEDLIGS